MNCNCAFKLHSIKSAYSTLLYTHTRLNSLNPFCLACTFSSSFILIVTRILLHMLMFLLGLLQVMTTGPWPLLLILSNTVYFIINIEVHRNANEPEPLLSLALASGFMQGKSPLPQSITPGSIQLYFCIFGKRLTILHCHISLFLKQNETESSQLYFRCLASAASLDKSFFFFSFFLPNRY